MTYRQVRKDVLRALEEGKDIYAIREGTGELILICGFYGEGSTLYGKRASDGFTFPISKIQFREAVSREND